MADGQPTTEAPAADGAEGTESDAPTEAPETETPPWGDDFDAARAWKTIQALRESERTLKGRVSGYEKADAEKADAEKSEIERLTDRLTAAEKALADRDHAALVAAVAKKHSLPEDLHEFLTGTDEAALTAQAERLAAKVKTAPADDLPPKPKPRLTPGEGADDASPEFDAARVAEAIRKG